MSDTTVDEGIEVRFVGFPLKVHQRSVQHFDELMREFTLIAEGTDQDGPAHPVPARLLEMVGELTQRYGGTTNSPDAERDAAFAAGQESIDLVYGWPRSLAADSMELLDILEEADQFCREGELLTLASQSDTVRFRRWYLREIARQIAGDPPTPWADFAG